MSEEQQPTWEAVRVMQWILDRQLPTPRPATPEDLAKQPWLNAIDARYRDRALFLSQLGPTYSQLGDLPAEMRLGIEPLHPLTNHDRDRVVAEMLSSMGAKNAPPDHQLGILSRALVNSYYPAADLFSGIQWPDSQDLFLFDNSTGFAMWKDATRIRNGWVGNINDIVNLAAQPEPLRRVLFQGPNDHFCIGRSLFLRLVGPLMLKRRLVTLDVADIPTVVVDTQADLDALVGDLSQACAHLPLKVYPVFRGQSREHLLPDRSALVAAGVCPFSDVRDHSIVPSLYRRYDRFLDDPELFRAFLTHLTDWHFYTDLMFGDPAQYFTIDGRPYKPKPMPPDARASLSFSFDGDADGELRAFADLGPRTTWTIYDGAGNVIDAYVKTFRLGHDAVRRNLVLQHYGAPTSYVDVTHDIRVAEWFALNALTIGSDGLSTSGMVNLPFDDPVIYVFLVLDGMVPIVDTQHLASEEEALRPHRQKCAVMGGAGNLYRNSSSRFVALKIKLARTFVPVGVPTARDLFPGPDEDKALKRLLERYEPPTSTAVTFPVYWFPGGAPE